MRVFVTGATGFVGSAVVQELLRGGHQVLGLARSAEGAESLIAAGAEVHRGDLQDLDSLRKGIANCDGVIHTGFIHDFTRFKEMCDLDGRVIEAIGSELAGSDRPFIVTSAIGLLTTPGRLATEQDMPSELSPNPRIVSEKAADIVAALGVRVAVLRLPPTVHGEGDHGFLTIIIGISREKGVSAYKDQGENRWPAVHRQDAATLYRLALENVSDAGVRYHAVAEEGVLFQDIARAVGKGANVRVESKSPEQTAEHFTWFNHFAGMDCAASSRKTKEMLGWNPVQPGLIEDLEQGHYFNQ